MLAILGLLSVAFAGAVLLPTARLDDDDDGFEDHADTTSPDQVYHPENDLLSGQMPADETHQSGVQQPDGSVTEAAAVAPIEDITALDYLNPADTDALLTDAADYLTRDADKDTFIIGDGYEALTIADYDPEEDSIVLLYDATGPEPTLQIDIDADGATLKADGAIVAVLPGVSDVRAEGIAWVAV